MVALPFHGFSADLELSNRSETPNSSPNQKKLPAHLLPTGAAELLLATRLGLRNSLRRPFDPKALNTHPEEILNLKSLSLHQLLQILKPTLHPEP